MLENPLSNLKIDLVSKIANTLDKVNIVILAGTPRSGKDTVINLMVGNQSQTEAYTEEISSIKFANEILISLGWDGKTKDAAYRKAVAAVKQVAIEYNDLPTRIISDHINNMVMRESLRETEPREMFFYINIRESSEITKLANASSLCGGVLYNDCNFTVVVVRDNNAEKETNVSSDSIKEVEKIMKEHEHIVVNNTEKHIEVLADTLKRIGLIK